MVCAITIDTRSRLYCPHNRALPVQSHSSRTLGHIWPTHARTHAVRCDLIRDDRGNKAGRSIKSRSNHFRLVCDLCSQLCPPNLSIIETHTHITHKRGNTIRVTEPSRQHVLLTGWQTSLLETRGRQAGKRLQIKQNRSNANTMGEESERVTLPPLALSET